MIFRHSIDGGIKLLFTVWVTAAVPRAKKWAASQM
jgi:hypothetical protein